MAFDKVVAEELLKKGLKEIGIICSDDQISAFMTFQSELKKWNRAYNLTALKSDKDIVEKHFLDSLLYAIAVPDGTLRLADAGTGAGFPGIPLKIAIPRLDMTLIESSRKKTAFLRHIIRLLKLSEINVIERRIENLGKEHEKKYDIIVSRATFNIEEFLKTACPYTKNDGRLILNKGPKVSRELRELETHTQFSGQVKKIHRLYLPFSGAERNLIVLSCGGTSVD